MSLSSLPRRSSTMLQSSSLPVTYQLAPGQRTIHRRPTIGAPDIMLVPESSSSLKRRSHIRRRSRSGNSPTESTCSTVPQSQPKPKPEPLIMAFARNISASTATSAAPMTSRCPTLTDSAVLEWRDSPSYQLNLSSKADLSRRSTVASVYSMPSALGHESRRATEENYEPEANWSFVTRALENRALIPSPSPSHTSPGPAHSSSSAYFGNPSNNSWSNSLTAELARSNTSQVHSWLLERRSKYIALPDSPSG